MSDEIQCPYCGYRPLANSDYYEYESDEFQIIEECGGCGKSYRWKWESIPYFTIDNPDCLNDDDAHNWIQHNLTYPKRKGWVVCADCGKEKKNEELWNKLEEEKKKKEGKTYEK